jgi:5-oxoprolinase (ATP-hydrolysing)
MMAIHTVAAGGSSILHFDDSRYLVGPDSAGSNPGAACYKKGGKLTISDCNVLLGKLQPQFFPRVFGKNADETLDKEIVITLFHRLAKEINDGRNSEEIASSYIAIAINNMANAIKKISLQRGYDVSEYVLCCFGGAGGQHACLLAEALGITQIFIHPYAGVLSAYGIGLADLRISKERSVEQLLTTSAINELDTIFRELKILAEGELLQQGITEKQNITIQQQVHLKYVGTDSSLIVDYNDVETMTADFQQLHQQRYGLIAPKQNLAIETASLELICPTDRPENCLIRQTKTTATVLPQETVSMYVNSTWQDTPVYQRKELAPGTVVNSPAIILEPTGTNIIELGWSAQISDRGDLILSKK